MTNLIKDALVASFFISIFKDLRICIEAYTKKIFSFAHQLNDYEKVYIPIPVFYGIGWVCPGKS